MVLADQGYGSGEQAAGIPLEFEPCMCVCILDRGGVARVGRDSSSVRVAERKKENRQPKRGIGEEDRVHTCTSRILEGRSGGQVGLSCS